MPTLVKVCGITRPEDARLALDLGADYVGVIVYEKSPRAVPEDQIARLLDIIPPGKRVLVDVATEPSRLEQYRNMGFDHFQIHFDLNIALAKISAWSEIAGARGFWAAPRIPDRESRFPQIVLEFADTILLDAYSKSVYGGSGRAGANWQRFLDYSILYQHKRWILAGGIAPDNVLEALRFTQAATIDANSGVESAPGIKDRQSMELLFARVRQYDRERADS